MKFFQYAGLLSAAFIGGFVANAAFDTESASAEDAKKTVVKADEFILTGKDGKTKARLGLNKKGDVTLDVIGSDGKTYPQLDDVEAIVAYEKSVAALRKEVKRLDSVEEVKDNKITVSHILISFAGTRTSATRTKKEAEILAAEVLAKVKAGEDFETLKKKYTNDGPGGTYTMILEGEANQAQKIFKRNGMVAAFGNVGWKLQKIGEVGVAGYDATTSPYGWHIIKRVANP